MKAQKEPISNYYLFMHHCINGRIRKNINESVNKFYGFKYNDQVVRKNLNDNKVPNKT